MSKNIVLKKGLDIPVSGSAGLRLSKTINPDMVEREESWRHNVIDSVLST